MKNSERVNFNDDKELIEFANGNVDSSVAEFKLKYFVGHSQVTPYHRLKQMFLELRIRQDSYLHIQWEIERKNLEQLVEEQKLRNSKNEIEKFILKEKIDLNKIKLITSLIYLNMSPMHTEPFSHLLYFLGLSRLRDYFYESK